MKKTNKNFAYVSHVKNKKTKAYRCRIQLNGKRWIEYFDSEEEALAYKLKISSERGSCYKKGDIQHHSLTYIWNEWFSTKSFEWSSSTSYIRKKNFNNVFSKLGDKWFHLISEDDCFEILNNETGTVHSQKYYMAFQSLDEMNKFCLNKYGYSLGWSVSIFRKKLKILKGIKKKPREYHTKDEMKSIATYLAHPDSVIKNKIILYHIYRVGISLGCRVGELCSLKKINFNAHEKTLIINSTISVNNTNVGHLKDSSLTKTKESRVIQLSNSAVDSLKYLASISKTNFIIPNIGNSDYLFLAPAFIRLSFMKILGDLKIIWIGTHGMFRKTFATQIALVSHKGHRDMIASIQSHLGHKSPQMTLHYIQAIDTNLDEELKLFDF